MRYHALAADYDGTLAHDGRISPETTTALKKLKASGRRLIMVTGRELEQLFEVCPEIDLFDRVVAENGALIYKPADQSIRKLAEPPPTEFVEELRRRGVEGISVGHVIVATWEPHQDAVLEAIHGQGLELQVIFNKGAVMILPSGVNKASGLKAVLRELKMSPHNVVGVGDAENDHAFLALCECSVAVANALPVICKKCDWTTPSPRGEGVTELIEQMVEYDLKDLERRLGRHHVSIGDAEDGETLDFPPYGVNIMICGTSGSGKSTLTTGLIERISDHGYQFVIMDPEGDYDELEFAINLGTPGNAATSEEVLEVLENPNDQVSVNMLGVGIDDRPEYFNHLLRQVLEMRSHTARPHWIVVDEAHHVLPVAWEHTEDVMPLKIGGMLYITVHPESVSLAVLETIDILIVTGDQPGRTIEAFCKTVGSAVPDLPRINSLSKHDVITWDRSRKEAVLVHSHKPRSERKRHLRKYAEGNLSEERSFYFRGPEKKLNLRAGNLTVFLQMADGVDDDTWRHHLYNGDVSGWFGDAGVKDDKLAEEAAAIEKQKDLSARESRKAIREIVERRYTRPAEAEKDS